MGKMILLSHPPGVCELVVAEEIRCRYYMLGLFLLIQLSIVGGDWIRRSIIPALANSMRLHSQDPSFVAAGELLLELADLLVCFVDEQRVMEVIVAAPYWSRALK